MTAYVTIEDIPQVLIERFWEKCGQAGADECWEWQGSRSPQGYGYFPSGRSWRNIRATHISLVLAGLPKKDGLFALHSCDNPPCVNPKHLRWGTNRENINDMIARGRVYRKAKGPRHD